MTSHTYSISGHVSSGRANVDRLTAEIAATPTILVALDGITIDGDALIVVFRAALDSAQEDALDALVAAHSGDPLPGGDVDERGNPVVAPTFMHTSERGRLAGFRFIAEAGEIAILDIEATTERLVQGANFWVMAGVDGDKASVSVVDKNDVLGLHTANGIPLGTPIELVRYATDIAIPTAALYQESIVMETVAPIAPGLFIRAQYEAGAGGAQRVIGLLFRWYLAI